MTPEPRISRFSRKCREIALYSGQSKSAKTLSVVGGLGVATGVTLLVLNGNKKSASADHPTLHLAVGPSSVALGGRF